MRQDSRIYVAGHRGLAGSALVRRLQAKGYRNLITRTHAELDLIDQRAAREFFQRERPQIVFLAAAKVGGILANDTYPADFVYQNLAIQNNVLQHAGEAGVQKLLFLGTACIYPRDCPQPIKEEYLLTGPLEPTNRAYALAKIAGIEMCWSFKRKYCTRYVRAMPIVHLQRGHGPRLHLPDGVVRGAHRGGLQLTAAPALQHRPRQRPDHRGARSADQGHRRKRRRDRPRSLH